MTARIRQLENCLRKHGISDKEWVAPSEYNEITAHHHQTFSIKIKQEPDQSFYSD